MKDPTVACRVLHYERMGIRSVIGDSSGSGSEAQDGPAILPVALDYVARGWTVVPLHRIDNNLCTCGNIDLEHTRRQGGKHPIHANWQMGSLRDAGSVAAYWGANPRANVGVATGRASGFWALDVDPDNGGDVALRGLVESNGPLPLTRKHQTGSGGYHLLWRMPADFEPTNSRGRLPAGLDVRGTGGQIVAPPSVSGKGPYLVLVDVEPTDAPGWLLDMIRPVEYEQRVTPAVTHSSESDARGHAYAVAAMEQRCAELARAPEGTRNETAFATACRLRELVNAGWIPADGAHAAYIEACEAADVGTTRFPPGEAESVWSKAWRHVAGGRAELPPDQMHGEALPFGATEVSTGIFADPGVAPSVQQAVQRASPGDTPPVQHQMRQTPIDMLRARLSTGAQFAAMAPPQPLIAGLLDRDSIAYMIGKSGSYKSFVALDLAASVACDMPWHGRRVHAGTVLYLCAEGQAGAHVRVAAWLRARKRTDTGGLLVLDVPVQARDETMWGAFVQLCRELGPVLIVIDTQARCSLGFEENSNSDMSLFVGQVDMLRAATGACVLVIHHIGRNGSDARGASVIDGAQDAELRVTRGASPLTCQLVTDKQKDRPDDTAIELRLDTVRMGWDPLSGEDVTSLVVSGEQQARSEVELAQDKATGRLTALVGVLRDNFDEGFGGTRAEIRAIFLADPCVSGESKSNRDKIWQRSFGRLVKLGRIAMVNGKERFKFIAIENLSDLSPNPGIKLADGLELATPEDIRGDRGNA